MRNALFKLLALPTEATQVDTAEDATRAVHFPLMIEVQLCCTSQCW